MTKRVAKIQDGTQACFAFILPHNKSLDFAAALHGMRHGLGLTCFQRIDIGFNPIKKRHVGDGAIFDDFSQARAELTSRQSFQNTQVADHSLRLIKSPNHVLAHGMVDGCFAAHRRVHLRQQSGWHLHKGHTSHEAGRCKTRHVADHATAKGKQNSFAITSLAEQAVKDKV